MTITETDRFETFCLYYDISNLTIITTHNVKLYSFSFLNYYEIKINIQYFEVSCKEQKHSIDDTKYALISM